MQSVTDKQIALIKAQYRAAGKPDSTNSSTPNPEQQIALQINADRVTLSSGNPDTGSDLDRMKRLQIQMQAEKAKQASLRK